MADVALLKDDKRVALWGWGREGHAAYAWIRQRQPNKALHVFATAPEIESLRELNDPNIAGFVVDEVTDFGDYDFVIKSPGITPYQPIVRAAQDKGTQFVGGTYLWAQEAADDDGVLRHTVCVTGTKGKSTSSALLAHLLRALGHKTLLAGNIGLPLLDEACTSDVEYRVIELSSYQTGDLGLSGAKPEVAVVVNVYPEHLDWHGSEAQYVEDKLKLVTVAKPLTAVLNFKDERLVSLRLPDSDIVYYGDDEGWHLNGDDLYRATEFIMHTQHLPLPGRHNRGNLCAVLTAIEALGLDARAAAPSAATFMPLPNRLQTMGVANGITYVNDSISTTPHATLAGLSCFESSDVALIVGGHDRGLDWHDFAATLSSLPNIPRKIITMGQNGPKIHALLQPLAEQGLFALEEATTLEDAVHAAQSTFVDADGTQSRVILLSPGAPSYGMYRDYVERGKHFASIAGFDPEKIAAIQGLGVA